MNASDGTATPAAARAIAIREARADDLAAIVAIYNEAVADGVATCDLSAIAPSARREWLAAHRDRHPVWVAESDGAVLGWIALSPYDEKPCFTHTGAISTYVARAARGRGVGSKLRSHLVDAATRLGFHALVTRVWAPNEAGVALNERFGWERVAHLREVVYRDGEFVDCFLYQTILAWGDR